MRNVLTLDNTSPSALTAAVLKLDSTTRDRLNDAIRVARFASTTAITLRKVRDGLACALSSTPLLRDAQVTAMRAAVKVLTEPNMPTAIGTISNCAAANGLSRFLARAGKLDDAVALLAEHAQYDDTVDEHYDLTPQQAWALLSPLTS